MAHAPVIDAVETFYQTHPISEKQILDKLSASGARLEDLTEDVLMEHDQDHFGGLSANDALAQLAGLTAADTVLDVCCGLGGPARYHAHTTGCHVTGIDLTDSRIDGAERLSAMVGLTPRLEFVCGNALAMPFRDGTFDVVMSQEAFCHVPEKTRLIRECGRVLKPGGRMAFTDILATDDTTEATRARLGREMTFTELARFEDYADFLDAAGCDLVVILDLGAAWRRILQDRLKMYRGLRSQTVDRFGLAHFEQWDSAYAFFVEQYATGQLTGGRFLARKR